MFLQFADVSQICLVSSCQGGCRRPICEDRSTSGQRIIPGLAARCQPGWLATTWRSMSWRLATICGATMVLRNTGWHPWIIFTF
eukprot:s1518_g6.t1